MQSTALIPKATWSEADRVAALDSYGILDTPREAAFDEVAELVSAICETPISVVNLIAETRQWFKAEVGLGVRETPLDSSFCAQAILQADFMIVPDATLDERFSCNPLVTGEPRLRFYAGGILRSPEGLPIGTLCVLDYVPRALTPLQERALRVLARQVMKQLELRRSLQGRAAAARRHKLIMDSATDFAIIALDPAGIVTDWNEGAHRTLGWGEAEMVGNPGHVFFTDEDRAAGVPDQEMQTARDVGHATDERWHQRKDGSRFWGQGMMTPLRSEVGAVIGYVKVFRDRTAQREATQQREGLMRELDHRVKNTLAMVQAIASQTLRSVQDKAAAAAFESRIVALSRAHDLLLAETWTSSRMSAIVAGALAIHDSGGRFDTEGPDLKLGPNASLSLALLLHELATNAAKYGALASEHGRVSVRWAIDAPDGVARLSFTWTERGGPAVVEPSRTGFGSRLIRTGLAGTGGVSVTYLPEGFVCRIEAPLASLRAT